ncbi:MAG TPA: uracil-DNA glycosylase family protein [Candidatus Limnocylindria bacterium]|nr:uracil-DNA glycosylase family protein [Candidatus Limnocylindria bacterium]
MNDAYRQLLDATVAHLEGLRDRGVTHIPVRQETVRALIAPLGRKPAPTMELAPTATSRPTPAMTRPANPVTGPTEPNFDAVETAKPPAPVAPPRPSQAAVARWSQAAPAKPPAVTPARPLAVNSTPLPPPLDAAGKEAAMAELRPKVLACVQCPHLASTRKNVVFGVGDIHSPLMFVGEAPGADEDIQGEPFVGKAGELLTRIIGAMGLSRSTVYIANVLKCRPDTTGQAFGNRKPTPEEMNTCLPWLQKQIDIIQPKVMVALGATAVEGLLGKSPVTITRLRGQWQTYRGIPLMPTYHPSYVLRTQTQAIKREVWEDMLKVMTQLAMPISEKQQAYFLKPG